MSAWRTLPAWPRLLSREQLCGYLGGIDEDTLAKVSSSTKPSTG